MQACDCVRQSLVALTSLHDGAGTSRPRPALHNIAFGPGELCLVKLLTPDSTGQPDASGGRFFPNQFNAYATLQSPFCAA